MKAKMDCLLPVIWINKLFVFLDRFISSQPDYSKVVDKEL